MIQLDDKTLRQLQMIELEMLIEVDRICKKCEIKYNIIAGTLLGAVRHGGFIPWDDDADVAMLRPEYEKFRNACKTELDTSRFYLDVYKRQIPIISAVEYLLCLGSALFVSAITVYIRDMEYLLKIVTMALQFLTPVMYSIDIVPQRFMAIYVLNPMTPIIIAYRDILYYKEIPRLTTLLHAFLMGLGLLVIGFLVFGKLKRRFAEEL